MYKYQQFRSLDLAFADFLVQRSSLNTTEKADFKALCIRLSYQQYLGHSCLQINTKEQQLVIASKLATTGIVTEDLLPLVLEKNRLYLQRYWFYENRLAQQLQNFLTYTKSNTNFTEFLGRYFTKPITDEQQKAITQAVNCHFSIISGGPGTGKTTIVVKILALLQELAQTQKHFLHIALAAPTGKAAARLQEVIGHSKNALSCTELIKQQIPEKVSTIHRLLNYRTYSPYFRHDCNNCLTYDLVVVDEVSMVDLALMSKLYDALKPNSRLILLGDKNQLSSVESGSVLADLITALPKYTTELKKSYRSCKKIQLLAEAVNKQEVDKAWKILTAGDQELGLWQQDLSVYAAEQYTAYLLEIKNNADYATIFKEFNRFRVLSSNRYGTKGVIEINYNIEKKLAQQNKIHPTTQWYIGRPIMVTQNDLGMRLYNGDIGICLLDQQSGQNKIFFLLPDGSIKKVLPTGMPKHETAFAMTIHKSQGSEFAECLCVLPDNSNLILSKELIYTAITRAKTKLQIVCSYAIFCYTLQQKIRRSSGLIEKIKIQQNSK